MPLFDDAPMLSAAGDIRFDVVAPQGIALPAPPLRGWSRRVRRGLDLRGAPHALLADAHGVWAWMPDDPYAPATRHGSVREWMRGNAGADLRLWVSAELTQSIDDAAVLPLRDAAGMRSHARQAFVDRHGDDAADWPLAAWQNDIARGVVALAGIDLDALRRHGAHNDVRIRSVEPWWHHAFLEARRCVPALARATRARVCVVEGRAAAWIEMSAGALVGMRLCMLEDSSVDALCATMARLEAERTAVGVPTVVLGQGLVDGGDVRRIDAHVLGRLDGAQPPQWLRPSTRREMH